MARLPKLIAALLALALGASGGAASLAASCAHMARTPAASTRARHDCCHAAHVHAHAATHGGVSTHAAHDKADAQTANNRAVATHEEAVATHEEDCAAGREQDAAQITFFGDDHAPCAGCCAERAVVQPRALVTAGTQQTERASDSRAAHAPDTFLSPSPVHTAFAPTQHAPPAASARLHILISIIRI